MRTANLLTTSGLILLAGVVLVDSVRLGGGVLGWVAGEMITKDTTVQSWTESRIGALDWGAPGVLAVALTLLGWMLARRASCTTPGQVRASEGVD
jgi:hypothetical protein